MTHRAAGLDRGLNARRSRTIADALARHGYDPAAGERARAAEPRPLGVTIPPPSADIVNLKIPKPYGQFGLALCSIKVTPRIAPGVSIKQGAWITPDEDGTDIAGCANVLAEDRSPSISEKSPLTR